MGPQLRFYLANRAGQTAIVRRSDGRVVGWVRRDVDGLFRGHLKGDQEPPAVTSGSATTTGALDLFAGHYADQIGG